MPGPGCWDAQMLIFFLIFFSDFQTFRAAPAARGTAIYADDGRGHQYELHLGCHQHKPTDDWAEQAVAVALGCYDEASAPI